MTTVISQQPEPEPATSVTTPGGGPAYPQPERRDLYPDDRDGVRSQLVEALRGRGVYPSDVTSLADDALLAKALSQTTRGRIINVGDTGEQDLLATIAGLDNAINNTSLIFTLEVGDDVLLLPGDAQWGPWQAILGNADTVALINRATFYKVSHHGSYNRTPKSLVAKLDRKITAGISVNRVTQWPNIPERALVNQLNRQMTIFQTNKPPPANTNISQAPDGSWIELALA